VTGDKVPGRSRVSSYKTRILMAILVSTSLLVVACAVVDAWMPEKAAERVIETLPEPYGARLFDEIRRPALGSDERCTGASIERLYGVEVGFQDIEAFYEASMHDFGWQRAEKLMTPTWRSPTGHFALAVYPDVDASFISNESIADARRQSSTVYVMVLSYVSDPEYCRAF
jgi:hypothetical protein